MKFRLLKKNIYGSVHGPYLGLVLFLFTILGLAPSSLNASSPSSVIKQPPSPLNEDTARGILLKAVENQFRGNYQATLTLAQEIFPNGIDSLFGQAEFHDEIGERKMSLAGPRRAFEYQSRRFGKEQWIVDDQNHRIRRIANRQWKKGVFGTLFSYEDILKFPNDFFLEYASCQGVKVIDSAYHIEMKVRPLFQTFYSKLDITLGMKPVLVKQIIFYGLQGQKLKTMEIKGYQAVGNKWMVTDLALFGSDSLSHLSMNFRNFTLPSAPLAQTSSSQRGNPLFLSKLFPKDFGNRTEFGLENSEIDREGLEETSN